MEIAKNIVYAAVAIILLIVLRSIMKKKEPDIEKAYRKILVSDENKVKGRFE